MDTSKSHFIDNYKYIVEKGVDREEICCGGKIVCCSDGYAEVNSPSGNIYSATHVHLGSLKVLRGKPYWIWPWYHSIDNFVGLSKEQIEFYITERCPEFIDLISKKNILLETKEDSMFLQALAFLCWGGEYAVLFDIQEVSETSTQFFVAIKDVKKIASPA